MVTHRKSIWILALLPLLVFCKEAATADKLFSVGGPRDLRAILRVDDDELVVIVDIIAVDTFDAAMNLDLSRLKSRAYAITIAARELAPKRVADGFTLALNSVSTFPSKRTNKRISTKFLFKKSRVRWIKKSDASASHLGDSPLSFNSKSVISRKSDWKQTVTLLRDVALSFEPEETDFTADAIEGVLKEANRIDKQFEFALDHIRRDKLLLSNERNELEALTKNLHQHCGRHFTNLLSKFE
jgi:hypothetical protein